MNTMITVEDLTFELRRSERRRTIGITIGRQGELIVSAPTDCPQDVIEQVAREKYGWIAAKLARKEMLFRPPATKTFVDGEGFYYLGRSYRLRIIQVASDDRSTPSLSLHKDRFLLRSDVVERGEEQFVQWYIQQGYQWLQQRIDAFAYRIDAHPQGIKVQTLGYRWGSCTHSNILYFHWRVILLPLPMIDYIVVHELVHLHERNHTPAFWDRVERAMPDYRERKRWLAENGSRF
ncbi:MAG: M48 family metallopeptidase [Ktedonobacteraceae bacterium]|nr:M48 family metallopeptidase [Ktedonobacteraceae bacterium]